MAATTAGCGSSSKGGDKTLSVWLGGDLSQATPGSPHRQWVAGLVKRFQALPGYADWKVKLTLLPSDVAQTSGRLQAAFSSHRAPDIVSLYGGTYTTAYARALVPLNTRIDDAKGFYDSIPASVWDLMCADSDCKGGTAPIVAVPWNTGAYFMYYNKALFAKAGVAAPPKTFEELFAACGKLRAAGILPMSVGFGDGAATSNWFTTNLVSTLSDGDLQAVVAGKLPYDDPKLVAALKAVYQVSSSASNCTSPNAKGQTQIQGIGGFSAGKAAMTPYYGVQLASFQKELGSKLGLARLPLSGDGPLLQKNNGYAADAFDDWAVPKDSKNQDAAWAFIKLASDPASNAKAQALMGLSPAVASVGAGLTDPLAKVSYESSGDPAVAHLDQVIPNRVTNFMFKQFSLGALGKQTAEQTLSAVDDFARSNG